jgi:carboxyl-terminal processing protease
MRKTFLIALGAAGGAAFALLASGQSSLIALESALAKPVTEASATFRNLELFGKVFDIARAQYVDKPDDGKLIASAINGMMSSLDPHSNYMDAKSFREMQAETNGEFGGLGLQVTMQDGLIKVVSPIDGTPAARAGLQANDIITEIDNQPVKGLTIQQAVNKMRGPPASTIRLKVTRKGRDEPIEATLTREIIHVQPVQARVEGDDIGYIRLSQFNANAGSALKAAITRLSEQIPRDKLKGYILDLRNNPGGLLGQAVEVANAFMSRGEIVSVRGRDADDAGRFEAKADPGDLTGGKPLIVLVNGGSASASEIVAGALQDQNRATIVGTRSFGKGSVQTIIPVGSNEGALRLTTARYFTPSGRSIQARGIAPDIEVRQDEPKDLHAEGKKFSEASLRGHLKAQGEELSGSQAYVPPNPQDDKALLVADDLLRHKHVDLDALASPRAALSKIGPEKQ